MLPICSLLAVLYIQLIIIRIGSIALTYTGLSSECAKFQVRSALSGCGFTTNETEQIMMNPMRRKVIMNLMLLGNIGIIASISTAITGFVDLDINQGWIFFAKIAVFVFGMILLWAMAQSTFFEKIIGKIFNVAVRKYDLFKVYRLNSICTLSENYQVVETLVHPDSRWVGKRVEQLNLDFYHIRILGIQSRNGEFIGYFKPTHKIRAEDLLTLYGDIAQLNDFVLAGRSEKPPHAAL